MEQLTSAIRELNTAILLDSSFAPFFNNRGLIYYRLGDEETACENYLKAIQLDSTHFLYYANLSLAYYEMRKLNEACKAINISKRLGLKLEGQADFLKVERACHLEPTFPQDSVYRLGK